MLDDSSTSLGDNSTSGSLTVVLVPGDKNTSGVHEIDDLMNLCCKMGMAE